MEKEKYIFPLKEQIEFDLFYLCQLEQKLLNSKNNILTEEENEYLLKWIVYRVQEHLPTVDKTFNLMCGPSAVLLTSILKALKIKFYQINIRKVLYEKINVHAVTIAHFQEDYMIDPSFRQFLVKEKCFPFKEEVDDEVYINASPGYYLSLTEEGTEFGTFLLNNGFYKMTDQNVKLYFDAFMMSVNEKRHRNLMYGLRTGKEYLESIKDCDYYHFNQKNKEMSLTPTKILHKKKNFI